MGRGKESGWKSTCSISSLGGEWSKNLVLLVGSLEATVTDLGGGVDELNVDLLRLPRLDSGENALSESDGSLAGSHNTTLDEEEVLVDDTVVREATHGGNVLHDGISLSGSVVVNTVDGTSTNSVDLLVELSSGVVAELTAAGDRPLDGGWMPGTDTGDLTETSMSLAVQTRDTESLDDTAVALAASDTDGINALGHLKDLTNLDLLLELGLSPVDLIGDGSTVNLDFHDVSLVLTKAELADLGGAENTDNTGVLLDACEITLVVSLSVGVLVLAVNILAEGLLLGVHPVLVESALHIGIQVLGEDGGEGAETTWGLNVADESNDLHGRGLNDGGRVDHILLDGLLTLTTLLILDDVGHASLVADEGGKVDGLGGVIAGVRSDAAARMAGAPLGQVGERAVSGVLVLTVRHSTR